MPVSYTHLRGPYHSRPFDSIVEECRELAARGVPEITLIAQDTSRYGNDFPEVKLLLPELDVYKRQEKTRPMAVVDSGVSSRIRYMLTCRGRAMSRLRRLPVTSSPLTE